MPEVVSLVAVGQLSCTLKRSLGLVHQKVAKMPHIAPVAKSRSLHSILVTVEDSMGCQESAYLVRREQVPSAPYRARNCSRNTGVEC